MKLTYIFVALPLVALGVRARHELPSRYALARRGNQFVTGPCSVDSDCQQGCCGFSTGKCAGPAVAQTNGSGGCGHGTAAPNCNVAAALGLSDCIAGAVNGDLADPAVQTAAAFVSQLDGLPFTPATASNTTSANTTSSNASTSSSSNATATAGVTAAPTADQSSKKTVFETCSADSDCQQGCCGFSTGKCAGPGIAQSNGSGGCGHGTAAPNCNVAAALGLDACVAGAVNGNLADPAVQAAAAFVSQLDGLPFTPASSSNASSSNASSNSAAAPAADQSSKSTVFETCSADSDCQQGCCGFSTGKCAGPAVAQTNGSGGCGHGTPVPNCSVAKALGFSDCVAGGTSDTTDPAVQAAAAFVSKLDNIPFTPAN